MNDSDIITFDVTCTMNVRWAEQFLGMLHQMQRLGSMGSSRNVTIFADGDGDFRPKFQLNSDEIIQNELRIAEPIHTDKSGNTFFDAG